MQWFRWAQRIQAIAQTGLTYAKDPYDLERYAELRQLAVDIAAAHLPEPRAKVEQAFAVETGYPTPKVDVRAAVFDHGRLLLVRERSDGLWSLPGGWADVGLSPGEVAVKEVREESGYEVRPGKLLAVWDRSRHTHEPSVQSIYKLVIQCDLLGGHPAISLETSGVGFFDRHAIPPLSTGRVTPEQIKRIFEHYDRPGLPADLD